MTDYSDASSTMAFDIPKKCWAIGLIEQRAWIRRKFAEIRPANSVVGEVTRAASEECDLCRARRWFWAAATALLPGGHGRCGPRETRSCEHRNLGL